MDNNLEKILRQREEMLPPELEDRMSMHVGTFSLFGKVIELFVPNALQTVVRMIGGDELPCIRERKKNTLYEPEWRTPPADKSGPGQI